MKKITHQIILILALANSALGAAPHVPPAGSSGSSGRTSYSSPTPSSSGSAGSFVPYHAKESPSSSSGKFTSWNAADFQRTLDNQKAASQSRMESSRQFNANLLKNLQDATRNNNNQGYGGGTGSSGEFQPYFPPGVEQLTPSQLAAQQRAWSKQQNEVKASAAAQARSEAKTAADLQKRQALEEGVANKYLKSSQLSAAARAEAAMMAEEQNEYWKRASNNIWNAKSKDPWADFRSKLEDWDRSMMALSQRSLNTPASQSDRPMLLENGQISTLKQKTRIGDNEWLKTIKSPNAKY